MDRIIKILHAKKMKGKDWEELASALPISSGGLRAAFSRGSVNDAYLDELERLLGIADHSTEETNDSSGKTLEHIIASRVMKVLEPRLKDLDLKIQSQRDDFVVLMTSLTKLRNQTDELSRSRKSSKSG